MCLVQLVKIQSAGVRSGAGVYIIFLHSFFIFNIVLFHTNGQFFINFELAGSFF